MLTPTSRLIKRAWYKKIDEREKEIFNFNKRISIAILALILYVKLFVVLSTLTPSSETC